MPIGVRQAEALGEDFLKKNISLDVVYASTLNRAMTTAKVVKDKQPNSDSIPFETSELLREQYFGAGEGKKICKVEKNLTLQAHYAQGKFPAVHTRDGTFPGGESLNDVARRAEKVIDTLLLQHLLQEKEGGKERVVAVFSHGIFIAELIAAIIRRDKDFATRCNVDVRNLRGLSNTGWTRLEVALKGNSESSLSGTKPEFCVRVNGANRTPHLANLERQKGGIGSMAHDPKQQDLRSFFGGTGGKQKPASKSTSRPKPYYDFTEVSWPVGIRQAEALGDDFNREDMVFSHIYASDREQAMTTASIIRGKQPRPDSIHFKTSHLLREQHFGGGEGQKILFEEEKGLTLRAHYAQGKFPIDYSRNGHFPGGESLNRVAARAEKAIDTLLYPLLVQGKADGKKRVIAIISHGTFITELVAAIARRDNDPKSTAKVAVRYLPGMPNASWIRLEEKPGSALHRTQAEFRACVADSNHKSLPANLESQISFPEWPLYSTLQQPGKKRGIRRKGEDGDPNQTDIRPFFGVISGGKQKASSKPNKRNKPYTRILTS
ncbi:LOW QUALITY PROTEIN: hypothetical protein CVT26_013307 [Gymnopilus dilepis]|uniref:Phosphoglycerate mutase-like protein n=1 Tax=Gymnopilus dilepis TaxID=231916 RepID=A0A409VUU7_9AGAR|nr:LOW QUALITY PROTEIN: hypothetical protein CVT26_013307 [Gymnopilus dilepis]